MIARDVEAAHPALIGSNTDRNLILIVADIRVFGYPDDFNVYFCVFQPIPSTNQ